MKKFMFAPLMLLLLLASCDVYVTETRYDTRDRMTGYFRAEEYSNTFHDYTYYKIYVTKNNSSRREIYIDNFYSANISIYAYVDNNTITIPFQIKGGYEIEGTGSYSGGDLHLTYSVHDLYSNTRTDFCDTYAARGY